MRYLVKLTPSAQRDIDDFARYCRNYAETFWHEQEARLARVFEIWLAESPHMWSFFFLTGAPYRAYLFQAGARTKFWIVYMIEEKAQSVTVLRMWNSARDPEKFVP